MAGRLASVPEYSTTGITAPYPPCNSYRESIRGVRVVWPEWQIGSTRSSQSGQTGSTYSSISGGSSSHRSNISADFGAEELTEIAHRMMSDGYTQRVIQAFGDGGRGQERALENWFVELDVDWVLEIRGGFGLQRQLQLLFQNSSSSWQQELIERWIRALTVIVISISYADVHNTPAAARFGKASISAMIAVVAPILDVLKVENPMVMQMFICVSSASIRLGAMHVVSSEAQSIFNEIGALLDREEIRLIETMSTSLSKMRMSLMGGDADGDADDSWVIGILRGGGGIHKNTRVLVGNIVVMKKVHASVQNSTQSHKTESLRTLIHGTIGYTKDLLLRKSELCGDLSLRYLFRLNNSYFVQQELSEASVLLDFEPWPRRHHRGLELTPECEQYMDCYLHVSWGHALSCILKSNSLGESKYRKKTSSLAEFHAAFHKTYQTQKFWKVPDPQLRSLLQETITKRVISGYCDYLMEHPKLEKQVRGGNNSPEVMEEMLGELFEG